jgi:cytolysin-activating lysine-acyltransferase
MALWSKKPKNDPETQPAAANGRGDGAVKPSAAAKTSTQTVAQTAAPTAAPTPAPTPAKASAAAAPESGSPLSDADVQQRGAASARLLLRFGEIVSVLMRAPQFRALPLGELQALVLPPLISGQFLVAEARSKSQGFITPVATALWAKVSKDVDKRLSENLDKPIKLAPEEWKSGDIAWLVVLAGNAQAIAPLLKKFQETTLKGAPLKMRSRTKDGKTVVSTFQAAAPGA